MSKSRQKRRKARRPAARRPSTPGGRPAPTGRPNQQRGRAPSRRPWWRSGWAVGGAIALAIAVGVAVQTTRSGTGSGSGKPRHALGPGGSEIEGKASAPVLVEQYGDFQCPNWDLQREAGGTIQQLLDAGTIRFATTRSHSSETSRLWRPTPRLCASDEGKVLAVPRRAVREPGTGELRAADAQLPDRPRHAGRHHVVVLLRLRERRHLRRLGQEADGRHVQTRRRRNTHALRQRTTAPGHLGQRPRDGRHRRPPARRPAGA